jgi:hypothetical protein
MRESVTAGRAVQHLLLLLKRSNTDIFIKKKKKEITFPDYPPGS